MALSKITSLATTTIKAGFTALNTLITDLLSTASGKGASQIGIEDSADNMAAANVEDALAEIYTDVGSAQTMADILDENPATTDGTTWGFKAGLIRTDNTITTVTASTVALTDDDVNYIEVRKNGSVVANVTGFTVGRIPIRQVTCASGEQTVSTDKRAWFHTLSDNVVIGTTITIPNTGLHLLDSNATHDLIIKPGANLSADKTLTLTTADADTTLTFLENLTIADGSAVTITAEDAAGAIVLDNCGLEVEDTTNAGNKIKIINATSDDDKVLTLHEGLTIGNGSAGTITFAAASKVLTLNESLTVGDGYDGTVTFSGSGKTLTVEGTSVVNQDLSSDASPTFAAATLSDLTASKVVVTDGDKKLESASALNVAMGGTGVNALTDHCVFVGSGTDAVTLLAAMTNGQLVVGATGADPAPQTMSGDATLAANGTLTIGADKILQGKIKRADSEYSYDIGLGSAHTHATSSGTYAIGTLSIKGETSDVTFNGYFDGQPGTGSYEEAKFKFTNGDGSNKRLCYLKQGYITAS